MKAQAVAPEKVQSSSTLLIALFAVTVAACGPVKPAETAVDLGSATSDSSTASSASSSPTNPVEYHASKLIGNNPLVPVRADGSNMENTFRNVLDAFGLVTIGDSGSCSGTHLGNGYVLTAGHCFLEGSNSSTASNAACPTIKVYWGYRGSPSTGSPKPVVTGMSQCSKLVYAELTADRDFAIFKVDSAPQTSVGVALESGRTAPNTKITIFGYPMGRPLEWSQYCSVTKSSVAGKPFNSPARVAYQCDTQPGNSGSSVIAVNSNGQPKVIGVHDAAAPDPIRYNIGTYMFDIRQALAKQGFNLDRETSATAAR